MVTFTVAADHGDGAVFSERCIASTNW